ncbi:uncharacterized protein LOC108462059 [Gossypium arboreum]|uniref:uncharacterized protein LOC108462059 n=1 Tax=Gossypium arboreum TaxID=29729 RepID=UPI0022F19AA1|nr:uncharacterized protein LOC108462059 [Gossypium arboreum]
MGDKSLGLRFHQVENGDTTDFGINSDWVLYFRNRICVPNDEDLRQSILRKAHSSPYAMHPDRNKMYRDLRELYWCPGLKLEVTEFVARCFTCQHKLSKLYIFEIVRLYGVPALVISDKDPRFMSQFWRKLYEALGSRLDFSSWEEYLLLAEFVYNNNFQSSIQMTPYEALDRLKATSDRQNSYADLKRREIEYFVGDFVFLKVLPWKKLELPFELDCIHDVFHVSMLRRYSSDPMHIVPVEEIEVRLDLTFEEEPIQILDSDI